ncbi:MAG: prepilin-type N-terminal cleavage/methylation domain-containing protein [Chthoniobacteraceae bacterium]
MVFSNIRSPFTWRSVKAFSLLELLVAMTILATLAVLSIPTLGLISSTSLTSAGNQIVDAANQARQNSISKNAWTALIINNNFAGPSAYCVIELTRQDDGSFGTWQTVLSWHYLPKGIVFSPTATTSLISDFLMTNGNPPLSLPTSYPFQGTQLDLTNANFQVYQPDGTLGAGQSLRLRLSEGFLAPGGTITYTHPTSSGSAANYYDIVFLRDTGQTKIERL